jgi:hypothetical protein
VKTEQEREKALEESIRETQKEKKPEPEEESTWGYLSRQWWFWTAVGVVAAGTATGTYFLATSGESSGGNLVIDLH